MNENQLKWYDKMGVERPEVIEHGVTQDDVRDKLQPLKTWNWHIEGNDLICDTSEGELHQRISPNLICLGTDSKGLPILKKVV